MKRRTALTTLATAAALPALSAPDPVKSKAKIKFCLNTSSVSGKKPGIERYIDLAARAGYEYIEPWMADIRAYVAGGGTLRALRQLMKDSQVAPANAIGFAPWMVNDDKRRREGFRQMREEMEILAALDCTRIAAPAAGVQETPDLFAVGERYRALLELGRQTGVRPQLEIWGASVFHHIGQAMMAIAVANDAEARILPDVYHLFRGASGFECLKMIQGSVVEVFHMNDYPGDMPRESMEDKDRVYPGDGAAPLQQIVTDLANMGGEKILSLELFNREYWQQDPLTVARQGLNKMKAACAAVL